MDFSNLHMLDDQIGCDFIGATGSDNYAIQLPSDFALVSDMGANPIAGDLNPLTANPVHLNKPSIPEPGLKCSRCDSTNNKFCHLNNYFLSQPSNKWAQVTT
jgi:Dof domain, zinc finger